MQWLMYFDGLFVFIRNIMKYAKALRVAATVSKYLEIQL